MFQNLKKSIKRHQKETCINDEIADQETLIKSKQAGLAVARTAYLVIKERQPFSKFPMMLLNLKLCNVNIGNINHSRFFLSSFLPCIKKALVERFIKYLKGPSSKTGFKLPISLVDDLATSAKKTRQFVHLIMPMTDSEVLLAAVPVAARAIATGGRTGEGLAATLKQVLDETEVSYSQVVSCTWDGAYIHEVLNTFILFCWISPKCKNDTSLFFIPHLSII